MTPIITLTLSPAFDLHCLCPDLAINRENLATVQSRDAGGKGINISRALTANQTPNLAITLLGAQNAAEFEQRLCDEDIIYKSITLPGRIRENVTLHTAEGRETRISFSGFSATDAVLKPLEEMIVGEVGAKPIFYLTLTGRVPDGMTMPALITFLCNMKAHGARIVLDSKSFSTRDILEIRPWLIKPNEEEISLYAPHRITSDDDAKAAITHLCRQGVENVLLTQGARGALLACGEGILEAQVPTIEVRSTIGAGDSTIAGFLASFAKGDDVQTSLARALAYGCAACLTDGTNPPRPEDIAQILPKISITYRAQENEL